MDEVLVVTPARMIVIVGGYPRYNNNNNTVGTADMLIIIINNKNSKAVTEETRGMTIGMIEEGMDTIGRQQQRPFLKEEVEAMVDTTLEDRRRRNNNNARLGTTRDTTIDTMRGIIRHQLNMGEAVVVAEEVEVHFLPLRRITRRQ